MFYSFDWSSVEDVSSIASKFQLIAIWLAIFAAIFSGISFFFQNRANSLRNPRTLTEKQISVMTEILKSNKGTVNFVRPSTSSEAEIFTYQLSIIFLDAGWKVTSDSCSVNMPHLSGVALLINDKLNDYKKAETILTAFYSAGIQLKRYKDDKETSDNLTILVCHKNNPMA